MSLRSFRSLAGSTLALTLFAGAFSVAAPAAAAPAALPAKAEKKSAVVIAHRGASGYRPEHTLAAYQLAIQQGADYVEPDLVITKDGVLVARHENEISGTTDVAKRPEFADRKTTKTIDGRAVTGWFTEDFTLPELKTLRAIERLPAVRPANTAYDGKFPVPTLQEVVDLVKRESKRRHRTIGIYPETKHPTYFRSIGKPLEEPLVKTLKRSHWKKVVIQSFETGNLRRLNRMIDVPLAQLIDAAGAPYGDGRTYDDLVTPAGLADIRTYADGVGLNTARVIPLDASGRTRPPTTVVADAHKAKLIVHVWTLRNENQFLPVDFRIGTDPTARGNVEGWLRLLLAQDIDGVFADFPDTARAVVDGKRAA
ncbi:glycerophosphodiester phosphodiesterase [Cryptosporangium aurantiacum]|uniref:glycerophosphodiester phosphodiesterase n=1 Tax=Cryptosporangium aurantiacum TaxID=134849 RepID=A0A1M7Q9T0_9ACTN|nr:glycerophosphodiester phosphodiesterase [Cryptosporangium aurantiacum]SHN27375.1 glycerophosphoryl diester phosphodiesterase [Cryptosporangium aurantiacum]